MWAHFSKMKWRHKKMSAMVCVFLAVRLVSNFLYTIEYLIIKRYKTHHNCRALVPTVHNSPPWQKSHAKMGLKRCFHKMCLMAKTQINFNGTFKNEETTWVPEGLFGQKKKIDFFFGKLKLAHCGLGGGPPWLSEGIAASDRRRTLEIRVKSNRWFYVHGWFNLLDENSVLTWLAAAHLERYIRFNKFASCRRVSNRKGVIRSSTYQQLLRSKIMRERVEDEAALL